MAEPGDTQFVAVYGRVAVQPASNHWVSKTTLLFDSRMPRESIFVRSASDYKSLHAQSLCTATNFASMGIESHNSNGYAH